MKSSMGKFKKSKRSKKSKDATPKPLRLRMPTYPITEDKLPLLIGEKISVDRYNTFVTRQEAPGYKFELSPNGDVNIVDMAGMEHEGIVGLVFLCFNNANGNYDWLDCPIQLSPQPLIYRPGGGAKIAPDLSIEPSEDFVQPPVEPYPGPPPGTPTLTPYPRVICEYAVHQSTASWIAKCEQWLTQPYVRYVFGVKIHDKRDTKIAGQYHRSMTARIWWQHGAPPPPGGLPVPPPPPPGAPAPVAGVAGVAPFSYTEWDFGTFQMGSHHLAPTGCNAVGLPAFQVQIPTSEIFWDPPIGAGGVGGYIAAIPPALVPPAVAPIAPSVNIDLYKIQRIVLKKQKNA